MGVSMSSSQRGKPALDKIRAGYRCFTNFNKNDEIKMKHEGKVCPQEYFGNGNRIRNINK